MNVEEYKGDMMCLGKEAEVPFRMSDAEISKVSRHLDMGVTNLLLAVLWH